MMIKNVPCKNLLPYKKIRSPKMLKNLDKVKYAFTRV